MPSTNGAKMIARNNDRPGKVRLSSRAIPSGTSTRNGTLATTKMAVARIPFQNGSNVIESGSNRSA